MNDIITPAQAELFHEAMVRGGYSNIAQTFLSALQNSTQFSDLEKTAIRLAGTQLESWRSGPLMGLLEITWEDCGLPPAVIAPLDPETREQIFQGVMDVCRSIVYADLQRLQGVIQADTSLPEGWATPAE